MSAQDVVSGATASSRRVFSADLRSRRSRRSKKGHLMPDHVRTCCCRSRRNMRCRRSSGTSEAIHMARVYGERKREFRRTAFCGPRFLRQHGRAGRGGDPRLHSQPRERGSEARTDKSLALKNAASGGRQTQGGASATPPTALSGSHKSPRICRGNLYSASSTNSIDGASSSAARLCRRELASRI